MSLPVSVRSLFILALTTGCTPTGSSTTDTDTDVEPDVEADTDSDSADDTDESVVVSTDVLFIGHSQVNHQMPGYFAWLLESDDDARVVARQVVGGGNLEEGYVLSGQISDSRDSSKDPDSKYFYFDGRLSDKGDDARQVIDGGVAQLVITEEHGLMQSIARQTSFQNSFGYSFPSVEYEGTTSGDEWLLNTYQASYELGSGLSFYHDTVSRNANARVYLYENFFPVVNGQTHCDHMNAVESVKTIADLNSWRKRVYAYAPAWQGVADTMNASIGVQADGFEYGEVDLPATVVSSGADVVVIPAAQALSVLVEDICAGAISDLDNPNELWADHVHMSQLGDFFIGAVMAAALRGESPSGIALEGSGSGRALNEEDLLTPSADMAEDLLTLAWQVVNGDRSASQTDMTSCAGIDQPLEWTEPWCIDDEDDEVIPAY